MFLALTVLTLRNLPKNAFATPPDAVVIGGSGGWSPTKTLIRGKSPLFYTLAGALGMVQGMGGVDFLIPSSGKLWAYGYLGASFGIDTACYTDADEFVGSGYVGLVWNVKKSRDYVGPFYCSSLAPSAIKARIASLRFPISAGIQVCTGDTGQDTAYGFTVSLAGYPAARAFRIASSFTNYWSFGEYDVPGLPAVAPDFESLSNLWRELL